MSSDPRSEALRALSTFLVADASMNDTLLRVTEITREAMPAADMAGISMLSEDGRPVTGIFTDEESPEIDSAQYESGNGPCLDAWREKRIIVIPDMTEAGDTYPEFGEAATRHGVLSTISLPLVAGDDGIGALNLYARTRHGFTDDDAAIGMELAGAAAVVLANADAYWSAYEKGRNLSEAMRSRATIEQAKGMLMAQSPNMTADDAFGVLRKASQRQNRKLRDVAQQIVERQVPPNAPEGDG